LTDCYRQALYFSRYYVPTAVLRLSEAFTLAWAYSLDGIARSADPHKLTHREARAMARAITTLAKHKS